LHGRVPPSSKQEAARDLSFPSRDNPVITCRYMYNSSVLHVQVVLGGAAGQSLGRASTLRIERFMQRVVAASRPASLCFSRAWNGRNRSRPSLGHVPGVIWPGTADLFPFFFSTHCFTFQS
jgi:hypothetical protein